MDDDLLKVFAFGNDFQNLDVGRLDLGRVIPDLNNLVNFGNEKNDMIEQYGSNNSLINTEAGSDMEEEKEENQFFKNIPFK